MRLLASDGEIGVLAFGTAPVGIIAIGAAPFGIVAIGPLATGIFAGSVGGGWVRGLVGGVCGVGLTTCWRSYIAGAGVAIGGKSYIVGAGLSVDAINQEGMSASWSWNARAPTLANLREWLNRRKRHRDVATELLAGGRSSGVVLADTKVDTNELTSGGVSIEATPLETGKVRYAQALGQKVEVEVLVEESRSQDGYRSTSHHRKLRLKRQLTPVTLELGSAGFWLMVAFIAGVSLFTRISSDVNSAGMELGTPWNVPVEAVSAPAVEHHRTMHGVLEEGDATLESGEFCDTYDVELVTGESVDFDLTSSDFDTYLIVRAPSGAQEDDDDLSDEDQDSRIAYEAFETGTHQVIATSFGRGERGSYQLVIDRGDRPFSVPKGVELFSEEVSGALSASDERMQSGEFRDRFQRSYTPGQLVAVRVESNDFDTYLIVRPPSGGQTDNDDLVGTNAGVDILSTEEGTYQFTVTSADSGETGDYVLRFHTWDNVDDVEEEVDEEVSTTYDANAERRARSMRKTLSP